MVCERDYRKTVQEAAAEALKAYEAAVAEHHPNGLPENEDEIADVVISARKKRDRQKELVMAFTGENDFLLDSGNDDEDVFELGEMPNMTVNEDSDAGSVNSDGNNNDNSDDNISDDNNSDGDSDSDSDVDDGDVGNGMSIGIFSENGDDDDDDSGSEAYSE